MKLPPFLICKDEGHILPADISEVVVNCIRCGECLYYNGSEHLAKSAEIKVVQQDITVGYFNWRQTLRGDATCEKVLKEHVDAWLAMNKNHYNNIYLPHIIHTEKLEEAQWGLSLMELAKQFPCPKLEELKDAPK